MSTENFKSLTKEELTAKKSAYLEHVNRLNGLTKMLLKNNGKPIVVDSVTVDTAMITRLQQEAHVHLRHLLNAKVRTPRKVAVAADGTPSSENVGFRQPGYYSQAVINWLLDPRTIAVTPANYVVDPSAPAGTPIQNFLHGCKDLLIEGTNFNVNGLFSAGIISSMFSIYLDYYHLKGVSVTYGAETKVDRRLWKPDANILQHFGAIINGPVKSGLDQKNTDRAKKIADDLEAGTPQEAKKYGPEYSIEKIPLGISMKMVACSKSPENAKPEVKEFLTHSGIVDLINGDQAKVTALASHLRTLREAAGKSVAAVAA